MTTCVDQAPGACGTPLSGIKAALVIGQRISTVETPVSYLAERVQTVVWIQWTNNWLTKAPPSQVVVYERGREVSRRALLTILPPKWLVLPLMPLTYLISLLTFIRAASQGGGPFDLCLGVTQFPGFVGVVLRRLGIVKSVIFLSCDYFPVKPWDLYSLVILLSNRMAKYALNHADVVWHVTSRLYEKEKAEGMVRDTGAPHLLVPEGIRKGAVTLARDYVRGQIVFVGQVGPHQGLQLVVDAMPAIREAVPDARFIVIGSGPYEATLKKAIADRQLKSAIEVVGYADRNKVDELLGRSAIAVACYVPDPYSFTYYAFPGKIMLYLSHGLPVVVTDVPPMAQTIEEKGAGLMIQYDSKQLVGAVIRLLGDPEALEGYRERARVLALEYDSELIYGPAFSNAVSRMRT